MHNTNIKAVLIFFFIISGILILSLPVINYLKSSKPVDLDNAFNTDVLESYVNHFVQQNLNRSLVQEQVIAGKNDFLFLGNQHNRIIHKTQGHYQYQESQVKKWIDKLSKIQQWYLNRDLPFMMLISPNKHSIYPEYLPDWIKYDASLTNDIYTFGKQKGIHLLDVRQLIRDKKNQSDDLLYLKTDTHWNRDTSAVVYDATIDYLNQTFNLNIKTPQYQFIEQNTGGKDLSKLLKTKALIAKDFEREKVYQFEQQHVVCLGNIAKESFELLPCKKRTNPIYDVYSQPQYTVNDNALNDYRVLMLCDSFCTQSSQLFNATFKQVWKLHYDLLNGHNLTEFVNVHKPDMIIYQVVERNAFNNSLVKSFPEIQFVQKAFNGYQKKIFDVFDENYYFSRNDHFTIENQALNIHNKDPRMVLNRTTTESSMTLLHIEMIAKQSSELQIFYKNLMDQNYSEEQSLKYPIKSGANDIYVEIPGQYINNKLRIDLANTLGQYQLKNLSLYEIN